MKLNEFDSPKNLFNIKIFWPLFLDQIYKKCTDNFFFHNGEKNFVHDGDDLCFYP